MDLQVRDIQFQQSLNWEQQKRASKACKDKDTFKWLLK